MFLHTQPIRLRGFLLSLLFVALFVLMFLSAPAALAADPCTTPGVVCVTASITSSAVWDSSHIYFVRGKIHVTSGATLTIQGGTIVKFEFSYGAGSPYNNLIIDKSANLVFQDTNATDKRVIFTSGRDDAIGGDTNGDANATLPDIGDWGGLELVDWTSAIPIENLTFRYSRDGVYLQASTLAIPATVIVQNNAFYQSTCGMTVAATSSYNNLATVRNNLFSGNQYGLCTFVPGTGQGNPFLQSNAFNGNTLLPVYLKGTSYPTYDANTFVGTADPSDPTNTTDHLGIGLGGKWAQSGTWTVVDGMPFVVVMSVDINSGVTITVNPGSVIKFFTQFDTTSPGTRLNIYGTFNLVATELSPITFTSYRDDTFGGDTNGDGNITEPNPADWDTLYYRDVAATAAPNLTIQYLDIRYATNGILYDAYASSSLRRPTFYKIAFTENLNGLRLKAVSNSTTSRLEPTIDWCRFENNGIIPINKDQTEPGVPIMLENAVQPVYTNNTFTGNKHPAIGVRGIWRSSATWTLVAGDGLASMPYLVHSDTQIGNTIGSKAHDDTVSLTLPAGSVIKFNVNQFDRANYKSRLTVAGILDLESTLSNPIVFTSYFDPVYGGDTSAESVAPAEQDWGGVMLRNNLSQIDYTIFRYGDKALHLQNNETDLTYFLDQNIINSRFELNEFGVYLDVEANADIKPLIQNNVFKQNSYGLGTFAKNTLTSSPKTTGMSLPTIRQNIIELSTQFPIHLGGSATLEFLEPNNTFRNNAHRAISISGYFGGTSATMKFPQIVGDSNAGGLLFPYVVWANTYFDWSTIAWVDGGLVYKFNDNVELRYYGRLDQNTTNVNLNYYTSYRDDYYDDTNGTPTPNPAPARGVWKGVYISNPNTSSFSYSTITYADQGLVLFQNGTNILQPTIVGDTFMENKNGLTCQIEANFNVLSLVANTVFVSNDYGLHTYVNTAATNHWGTCNLSLSNNTFQLHSEFPIYLQGTANPVYNANTFVDNTHPAIAVGGGWFGNATWWRVYDQTLNQMMPYVVKENVSLALGVSVPSLTIPADSIVKLMDGKYIYIWGILNLLSSEGHEAVFTSYADDVYGGDINHNGTTIPVRTAWKTVWLIDYPGKTNDIHDVIVRYATAGLGIYYNGPENTQLMTTIRHADMNNNWSCIALAIGWESTAYPGAGNIIPSLSDIQMSDSDYGLLTIAMDKTTGVMYPNLENVSFYNITRYPLFLGGTAYPTFGAGVTISETPDFAARRAALNLAAPTNMEAVVLEGVDLSHYRAALEHIKPGLEKITPPAQTEAKISVTPDLFPAIGLAGFWNNSGTLPNVPGVSYAVTGGFPLTIIVGPVSYLPSNDVTVGMTNPAGSLATVTIPAGSVYKFGSGRMMTIRGGITLQSTPTQPIIFTSIKDDTAYGDTNRDGTTTRPAKGDWAEVRLAYGAPDFHHAVVRYATNGLHLYFDGLENQNLVATVRESIFTNNTYGMLLTAKKMGDVVATITQNTFKTNGTHIYGVASDVGNTGSLCVVADHNDLWGTSSQPGINNLNLNGTDTVNCPTVAFDGRNNYWGSATGPTHAGNPSGTGTQVSDRVLYNPWLGASVIPPATYSISGKVTHDTSLGAGLPGVTIFIQGPTNLSAVTDQDGHYLIEDLAEGTYLVYPSLAGYAFTPSSLVLTIDSSDVTELNFIAVMNTVDVSISMLPVIAMRSPSGTSQSCKFTISIDKPLPTGKTARVNYATVNGTALSGTDYTSKSGTLTFTAGQALSQQVAVTLLPRPLTDPSKYFTLILTVPVNANLTNSAATCTIISAKKIYLPMVRK